MEFLQAGTFFQSSPNTPERESKRSQHHKFIFVNFVFHPLTPVRVGGVAQEAQTPLDPVTSTRSSWGMQSYSPSSRETRSVQGVLERYVFQACNRL